ncbi:MAG: alpha/beta hydrolase family protein, partial [Actinomycetota bacterium]
DLATSSLAAIEHAAGSIGAARVRPDGDVWFRLSSGGRPPAIHDGAGAEVLRAEGERAPAGRPFESWHFDNGEGDRVHGFTVTPEGEGPFPVMMFVHGGPTGQDMDAWDPEVLAYVEMGFAVAMVNYRGSTGYGREWRDRLIGDIGGPELVDVNAGLADLVARGVADPDRAVVGGWSWGGYITLMELCKHPDLWLAGVAGVPVGDYELSYEDLSPELQAYDRALLGGTPDDVPELMADRNPINFVDRVRAPVIFLIGENDSRCPFRQAMAFVDKLAERNHPHELVLFGTGHGSFDIDEEIRQMGAIMRFLGEHVPGVSAEPPLA